MIRERAIDALRNSQREKEAWARLREEMARVHSRVRKRIAARPRAHGPPNDPNGNLDYFEQAASFLENDAWHELFREGVRDDLVSLFNDPDLDLPPRFPELDAAIRAYQETNSRNAVEDVGSYCEELAQKYAHEERD